MDCANLASDLSCAAMIELAKRESAGNAYVQRYMVNAYPAAERFCELMDRTAETTLQKAPNTGKRLCITKQPHYQEGPWSEAFAPLIPPGVTTENARYAVHTKAKAPAFM